MDCYWKEHILGSGAGGLSKSIRLFFRVPCPSVREAFHSAIQLTNTEHYLCTRLYLVGEIPPERL